MRPEPSGAAARSGAPPAWLIAFLIAVTAAHLLAAAFVPLSEDEAYYRLWAQHLALGYFDHPPMIAWWIRAGMALAGDNALGVRLIPALTGGLSGFLVFDLARRLGADEAVAARATVWLNATFMIAVGTGFATPDAAATPFWLATLCCLARTTEGTGMEGTGHGRDRIQILSLVVWWLAAGACAGLACLSKYSALFLAPGAVLWLAMRPGGLAELKRPWPWAAAVLAAAIFAPNVAWNAAHHWQTFDKQFGRIAPDGFTPVHLPELLAGQFLMLNPVIAVFAVRELARPWRASPSPGAPDLILPIASSLPFAAYLVLHSLHARVEAHWPTPIYPALAIVAASAAEGARGWLVRLKALAAPLGLGLAALLLIHVAAPITDIPRMPDRISDFRGWPQFAANAGRLRDQRGGAWIGTLSYGVAAQLDAAHAPAPVLQLTERDRYGPDDPSQRANLSRPGLVVDLPRRVKEAFLQRCFTDVTPVGAVDRPLAGGRVQHNPAFLVEGPRWNVLARGCDAR